MRVNFEEGIERLENRYQYRLTYNEKMRTEFFPEFDSQSKHYKGCTFTLASPKGNAKPHVQILNYKGDVIIDIDARKACYKELLGLIGAVADISICHASYDYYERKINSSYIQIDLKIRREVSVEKDIERIVVDTETTGIDPRNEEFLQVAIIDGQGNTLINRYYKPKHKTSWDGAEKINGISPEFVANKPYFEKDLSEIQNIFDRAKEIIVYNAEFDMSFFGMAGIKADWNLVTDAMSEYGEKFHGKRFYKLTKAAEEIGYTYKAHDALEDCKATLAVINRVNQSKP